MNRLAGFAIALVVALSPCSSIAQEAPATAAPGARPSIYDAKADAHKQVEAAGRKAARDNQRILVMFDGDWCGWCHKLHALFRSDAEIRKILMEDYQLVMVDTKAPNAEALLAECQGDLTGVGFPFLAVMAPDGTILTRQKTDPLEEGDHHDPGKVKAFLAANAPAKQSATKIVEDALAKAASEDRRVFLRLGAPWCGWCHKLDDFLAREDIAPLIGEDYIGVKVDVDRMEGADEVVARFRPKPEGGIPWSVILDGKGKPIIDSDGPKGNIGYPVTPDEIAHFMAMMKAGSKQLGERDLKTIEDALKQEAEKIEGGRRPAAAEPIR